MDISDSLFLAGFSGVVVIYFGLGAFDNVFAYGVKYVGIFTWICALYPLVIKKFGETLSKMGVTPIDAIGKPFDPEFHNAVMNSEEGEGESGTVLDEFQKGYMLKDKVIRHSMVKVKA